MNAKVSINGDAATVAGNLRRIMARDDLTFEQVVAATGLDERTLRALARGTNRPHARTLHKLAQGLGISIDELFRTAGRAAARTFDRVTNSLVESCVARHADLFRSWSEGDFDELYSRFGTGGQLTEEGILAAAQATNDKRDLWRQVSIILESGEAELLAQFVNILYGRVTSILPYEEADTASRTRILSRTPANHGDRVI
ncbi:MAG TPA: helix-turn-helix transcriptional regulator [Lacipirellulaceae bacterium]|nr:helix-turn-helix transcriptional regulator [Lacipirellulaceae bacterium]